MRCTGLASAIGSILTIFLLTVPFSATAEPLDLALVGTVASAPEGRIEGLLVSARNQRSTLTVTVVSDEPGH